MLFNHFSIALSEQNDSVSRSKYCEHKFHTSCYKQWFMKDNGKHLTCPYCRCEIFRRPSLLLKESQATTNRNSQNASSPYMWLLESRYSRGDDWYHISTFLEPFYKSKYRMLYAIFYSLKGMHLSSTNTVMYSTTTTGSSFDLLRENNALVIIRGSEHATIVSRKSASFRINGHAYIINSIEYVCKEERVLSFEQN